MVCTHIDQQLKACANQACYIAGIMHRDIKLENILLTSDGADASVKLADFGLSTCYSDPKQRFRDRAGSSGYMVPEVIKHDYDYRADLFSIGVVLYTMLCGRVPFWGDTGMLAVLQTCLYAHAFA